MSKYIIMSVVAVMLLAGVAAAVPTGPGGTLYFAFSTNAGVDALNYQFAYLDVNSNWAPIGTVQYFTTITMVESIQQCAPRGNDRAWFNSATGKFDESSLHGANLFVSGRYDNVQDPESTSADNTGWGGQGSDIMSVNGSNGAITPLNQGWDTLNPASYGTAEGNYYATLPIDNGFTPNGEAKGFFVQGSSKHSIWTDSDSDGNYETHTLGTSFAPVTISNYSAGEHSYTKLGAGATVNFGSGAEAVTGVIGGNYQAGAIWDFTYKKSAGTYATVLSYSSNGYDGGAPGSYDAGDFIANNANNNRGVQVGDTDGDGHMDIYYPGLVSSYRIIHAEDLNDDGDILDQNECDLNNGLQHGGVYQYDMQLVDLGAATYGESHTSRYALVMWSQDFAYDTLPKMAAYARIAFLSSSGLYDGNGIYVIDSVSVTAGGVVTGDSSMTGLKIRPGDLYGNAFFVPLAQAEIPEPGTMLLVGTGVLSLAGVLRRRLLG